jgi:hypothetical protein
MVNTNLNSLSGANPSLHEKSKPSSRRRAFASPSEKIKTFDNDIARNTQTNRKPEKDNPSLQNNVRSSIKSPRVE